MVTLLIILGVISAAALSSFVDDSNGSRTWNEFCNIECLSRRIRKQCC
ncbi:MAG: hypothetical protein Q8930_16135 [Bacillota bacterium]|nr:hypothetical protein [Bacillota bacterium]